MIFGNWLSHQLRLADRQGLLRGGKDMSVVQSFAAELLMVADNQIKAADDEWTFKTRYAAGNPELMRTLLSEDKKISDENTEDRVERIVEEGAWDEVEWTSPAETGIEAYESVMAEIEALKSLTINPGDREAGWL